MTTIIRTTDTGQTAEASHTNPRFRVRDWDGGRLNIAVANEGRAEVAHLPMTPLAKGRGRWRVSKDGVYGYYHEEHAGWDVKYLPTDTWITQQADLNYPAWGFADLASARRWTATGPVPTP